MIGLADLVHPTSRASSRAFSLLPGRSVRLVRFRVGVRGRSPDSAYSFTNGLSPTLTFEQETLERNGTRPCRRRPPSRRWSRRRGRGRRAARSRPGDRLLGVGPRRLLRAAKRSRASPGHRRQRGDGHHRPVGLRQEHAAPLLQPHERPRPGARVEGKILYHGHDVYADGVERHRGPPPDRHGVPEAEPVPQVDLRQRRLRPPAQRHEEGHSTTSSRSRSPPPPCGTRSRTSSTAAASTSPAASSSGCASPGPSPSSPT